MKDKKHAELLLKIALRDINALKGMLNDKDSFEDSIFGFHAQQAAQKILKAFLSFHRVEFKKTHDLTSLFMLLKDKDEDIFERFFDLRKLTDFAVDYRYELIFEEEQLDRQHILKFIEDFYTCILAEVNK